MRDRLFRGLEGSEGGRRAGGKRDRGLGMGMRMWGGGNSRGEMRVKDV